MTLREKGQGGGGRGGRRDREMNYAMMMPMTYDC